MSLYNNIQERLIELNKGLEITQEQIKQKTQAIIKLRQEIMAHTTIIAPYNSNHQEINAIQLEKDYQYYLTSINIEIYKNIDSSLGQITAQIEQDHYSMALNKVNDFDIKINLLAQQMQYLKTIEDMLKLYRNEQKINLLFERIAKAVGILQSDTEKTMEANTERQNTHTNVLSQLNNSPTYPRKLH